MRDLIRLNVDNVVGCKTEQIFFQFNLNFFLAFKPQIDPYLVKVDFIPVKIYQSKKLKNTTLFVIEIHVNKGRAPIYFCQGQKAFYRLNGSIRQMDQSTINDRLHLGRPLKSGY